MHFQEEQMGACEHGSFRHSGEDVLAKSPRGVHLVQAKTAYSMRRLNEAWKCLQLWGGGLVEGAAFSWEASLFGSWWWLSGHLWERRKKMPLWGGNTMNTTHPLQAPFVGGGLRSHPHVAQPSSCCTGRLIVTGSMSSEWKTDASKGSSQGAFSSHQLFDIIFHSMAFHAASH